jgi:hypothetical protein
MQGRKEDKGTQEVSGSSEARQGVASTNSSQFSFFFLGEVTNIVVLNC